MFCNQTNIRRRRMRMVIRVWMILNWNDTLIRRGLDVLQSEKHKEEEDEDGEEEDNKSEEKEEEGKRG